MSSVVGPVTRAYGPETLNHYTHGPLNRLSFLRGDYKFLAKAFKAPTTRFLLLNKLDPLAVKIEKDKRTTTTASVGDGTKFPSAVPPSYNLAYVGYEDVASIVGEPFAKSVDELVAEWDSKRDAVGVGRVLSVFLGADESVETEKLADGRYQGHVYFAVDVTPAKATDPELQKRVEAVIDKVVDPAKGVEFVSPRFGGRFAFQEYGLYAQARQYVDWNNRSRFCAGCGARTMSIEAGCKLTCPPTDAGVELPPCETRGVVTYHSFPRTDPTVIMSVVNHRGDRILLGNGRRHPKGMYTTLAGFLEPAESVEDCVRREVWEESGVRVGRVYVHSTQPWPFPANLMIGCVAEVADDSDAAHAIDLGHDPELNDAQWFEFGPVREALERSKEPGFNLFSSDGFRVPPPEAVAHHLIDSIVNGTWVRGPTSDVTNSKI